MEVQQLTEISEKIYSNLQTLLPADIKAIEDILKKDTIKYGKIRTFNLSDSQDIVLLTLKQNCLILVKYLLENEIEIPNMLLDVIYNLNSLRIRYSYHGIDNIQRNTAENLQAQIEKEKIIDSILNLIIDIVFLSKYWNDDLIKVLKEKKVPDDFSVNLSIAIEKELDLDSFELTVLSKRLLGPVFLSLVKSYKETMRKMTKKRIIEIASDNLESKDRNIAFEIFYHLNEDPQKSILASTKIESIPQYFAFVSSLIVNKESAEIAYGKLEPFFENLSTVLQTLLSLSKDEDKSILPQDEEMIRFLLECVNRISVFKSIWFFKYISLFQSILKIKISRHIKGIIYDILSKYVLERDLYINKIVECRDDVEKEIKTRDFYLLPRLIKFLNAYYKREEKEIELMNIGASIGSPYLSGESKTSNSFTDSTGRIDFRILGLKSEDPNTVKECLEAYISPDILKMYSSHLRNTIVKDASVIRSLIEFQIEHKCIIEDMSIINSIISYSSSMFFEYVKLFKDFSFYLNGDFLERICDDLETAIEWINNSYNKEIGVFILRNSGYFNELLRRNDSIQPKIIKIYENILNENLGNIEIKIFSKDDSEKQNVLMIHDTQELLDEIFFRIFSKQLMFSKFFRSVENLEKLVLKKYVSPFYGLYVKSKVVCGLNVSDDIQFMTKNLLINEDLLGYLSVVGAYVPENRNISSNILLNFGIKDNSLFLKNFTDASDFEKFVLFFNIASVTKEIDFIIKEEVMKSLKNTNKIYLRMCILQLFRTRELDQIIKILEKNYDDKELLFKLCVHNIVTGGKYFSKDLLHYGDENTKNKALFLLYYLNIWDKEYLAGLIGKIDPETSEDMKYLIDDMQKH